MTHKWSRAIIAGTVPLAVLAVALATGLIVVRRCKDYAELTIRNDTDRVVRVWPTQRGDTTFFGTVPPRSTTTVQPVVTFAHPDSIDIVLEPGFTEHCSWSAAKRRDPLVVTLDGAGCGELILDQPVSPLQ